MSKLLALAVCLVTTTAFAADQTAPDPASHYVDAFVKGDMQTLLQHASPQLKQLMKDDKSMQQMRTGSVGDHPQLVSTVCTRTMKGPNGQMWSITATVAPNGELAGFMVAPAKGP